MMKVIRRRKFTKDVLQLGVGAVFLSGCKSNQLKTTNAASNSIDSIDLYLVNVTKKRNFSHSTWHNRQHIFIAIRSNGITGWSETLANKNDLNFDIVEWGAYLLGLNGKSIEEGLKITRSNAFSKKWNAKKSEPILMALYDIQGKIVNKPTIELWGLEGRDPVPGLFCILEKDVNLALVQAEIAKAQGLNNFIKVKMFGDVELDLALTKALRKSFGPDTFLMADANRGYKEWKSLEKLAGLMKNLHNAGLDAMEDPAEMSKEQWIVLQAMVGEFSLIPDRPMRPAFKALDLFSPEMGHYFNIHPDTMSTFNEAVELGKKIKAHDRGLMIGDSSLIGPACTFWQQMAIGLGASWVEAIEKPQESDVFEKCVVKRSTIIGKDGNSQITKLRPGFGIEMNEAKLKSMADNYAKLF
ncbi:MAG: L-alanine-DL-glutamate epimerase-like enolase superfamily enzyme [Saprospiraceae bacterium]|jgi:L-alanine-DL-glutamate epimerase-like enolase superfamily enzyme